MGEGIEEQKWGQFKRRAWGCPFKEASKEGLKNELKKAVGHFKKD